MLNGLQPWHLIILVLVVVLLFGAKRLPDAARSIGKSMKIFKAETKDMRDGAKADEPAEDADAKQLPAAKPAEDDEVAKLQRQLDELKKQQASKQSTAEQAQKNAS
ncbi:Sec-independent protein translocase subunit TatA [Amycolatopsis sp. CA-230715]|uniref:Sec-independent protein translocase subunit TatA n=1 Tax=Amycolatopsis sp. CA-230715 TaxID=2745196 RepID=UPI001C0213E8|nr:Sec-independent protein translocase subunit TatA [Amycolatopsis sp. CA-230715]QWF85437.1 Sec-independent protein translocase protein TatA [Amycolatopsis sp. CA-230715]